MKIPKYSATLAGGAIGFAVGGPIGAPIGLAVGGLTDWLRGRTKAQPPPPAALQVLSGQTGVHPAVMSSASTAAAAGPPPEAIALKNYLVARKAAIGNAAYNDPAVLMYVTPFQIRTSHDANYLKAFGRPLPLTGKFDVPTSLALIFYTHTPIGPDPSTDPGAKLAAAIASANNAPPPQGGGGGGPSAGGGVSVGTGGSISLGF